MKLLAAITIALGLAIALGLLAVNDPGYVMISRAPYEIELPLALFVLFLLALFAALYLLFNALASLARTPRQLRKWNKSRNENKAQNQTLKGYAGLIEGEWHSAEQQLTDRLEHCKTPLLNYLGAAYAAQQQGNIERRDRYLDQAIEKDPSHRIAVDLSRARLQIQMGQYGDARELLEEVRRVAPNNLPALRLLADVYRELKDWPALTDLAPVLAKKRAFPDGELRRRELEAYHCYLESPSVDLRDDELRLSMSWASLPRAKRNDPAVLASYVRQLIKSGNMHQAEKLLRTALLKRWSGELVELYGQVQSPTPKNQIKMAESWLTEHGRDADLNLALGQLYLRHGQRDKGIEYVQRAAELSENSVIYAELGKLLEESGQIRQALRSYKRGLKAQEHATIYRPSSPAESQLILFGDSGEERAPQTPLKQSSTSRESAISTTAETTDQAVSSSRS